jgi:purine nucleoside permease
VVNAALSTATLASSKQFDLSKTYFLLTGIAGVNPRIGTIGAVAFARFAVQVDTQLEFDARTIPRTWDSGYVPLLADTPDGYPKLLHGSEIFELNTDLRDIAISFARAATLEDSPAAAEHRALYAKSPNGIYHAATLEPSILEGDVISGNVWWHGTLLGECMEKVVKIYTSDKGEYCMTALEDTGILAALLRAALQKKVDFSRIILMRAGSNFRSESLDQ